MSLAREVAADVHQVFLFPRLPPEAAGGGREMDWWTANSLTKLVHQPHKTGWGRTQTVQLGIGEIIPSPTGRCNGPAWGSETWAEGGTEGADGVEGVGSLFRAKVHEFGRVHVRKRLPTPWPGPTHCAWFCAAHPNPLPGVPGRGSCVRPFFTTRLPSARRSVRPGVGGPAVGLWPGTGRPRGCMS
jgi:hypothetical protein